ncbi:MAG: Na+/H+ antiporter NhaA [Rhizorhabdus sp.]
MLGTARDMSATDTSSNERNAGLLLIAAAGVGLALANSPLRDGYTDVLHAYVGPLTVEHWIADALMAVFFLLVGLEVKREWYDGQLATPAARRLPIVAAIAGMAVPAVIYLAVTGADPALRNGWAIPAATDIAFALGVLALIGGRAPSALKLLLVTIAIIDDIGAVAIIAAFYTENLDLAALAVAIALTAGMVGLRRAGVFRLWPYLLGFALLWLAVLQSGVHATIAGVVAALTIPLKCGDHSPLERLEQAIHPWVMFGVVPLFGLASAGVTVAGLESLLAPLPLGVALGLFLGKQIGVFGAVWLADRTGFAPKPAHLGWNHLYGASLLCGIGFTMSLFIGALAFSDARLVDAAKLGTLLGSALSVLAAFAVLTRARRKTAHDPDVGEAAEVFGGNFEPDPDEVQTRG